MNVKRGDWVQSLAASVLAGCLVGYFANRDDRSDTDGRTLAKVEEKVDNLTEQFNKFAEQPYVRRDEFQQGVADIKDSLSGLESRIDRLEGRVGPGRETNR